jgi:hypothetical protein
MALKKVLANLDGLAKAVADQYKKVGEEYHLDLEGTDEEDTGALKRAKEREVEARKKAQKDLKEAQDRVTELEAEAEKGRTKPEEAVAAAEKKWGKKYLDLETQTKTQLSARDKRLQELLVDNVAKDIAGKISTSPRLLIPHLKARLATGGEDGVFETVVLDKEGKPSALTVDQLSKEFIDNADFAPILIATKGSGGGAGRSKGAGGADDLSQYRNADGSTKWGMVTAEVLAADPKIIEKLSSPPAA